FGPFHRVHYLNDVFLELYICIDRRIVQLQKFLILLYKLMIFNQKIKP
ncbi:hypothetical protein SNEBB_003440, partial [Seison nebaliae]